LNSQPEPDIFLPVVTEQWLPASAIALAYSFNLFLKSVALPLS